MTIRLFVILILLFVRGGVSAAEISLPQERVLPLDMAHKAAEAALKQCKSDGYKVSVAIVDRAGILKVILRSDGAGPHTIDSSRKKAYTSASMRRTTSFFAGLIAKKPDLAGLRDMNEDILILGGGLPIVIEGEVVGGIGVGGAPGAHLDEACAKSGLIKIGAEIGGEK